MNNKTNSPVCERASDLIAFLYNEANESEARDFELHLQNCGTCREEVASFGVVRESIGAWREEALAGFVSTPLPVRRSALAAFRQFFDLSPFWLKGAAAFAVLIFCVLIGLAFVNLKKEEAVAEKTGAVYTQQDVDRLIGEALARQANTPVDKTPEPVVAVKESREPKPVQRQTGRSRRPLSRSEREQLAADLRLVPTDDDLDLLGDRINR